MRVKIEQGAASIEVDGEFDEVKALLEQWWKPGMAIEAEQHTGGGASTPGENRKPSRKAKRTPRPAAPASESTFDVDGVVNRIKDHPQFDTFKEKIILPERGRAHKARFVSWYLHDQVLTTGNVHKVLQKLGVKIDLSTVSRAMSGDAKDDYMVDRSGPQPTYVLTTRAYEAFGKWIGNGSSEN